MVQLHSYAESFNRDLEIIIYIYIYCCFGGGGGGGGGVTLLILLYNLRKENEYNIAKSIDFEHINKVNIF